MSVNHQIGSESHNLELENTNDRDDSIKRPFFAHSDKDSAQEIGEHIEEAFPDPNFRSYYLLCLWEAMKIE